jgi:hypothetical protein
MATYAEAWNSLCQTCCIFERAPGRHERGGGHDSASVRIDDGAIDAQGEAKVIRIDDQAAHRVSLAGEKRSSRTLALGLTDFSLVAYTHCSAVRADAPQLSFDRRGTFPDQGPKGRGHAQAKVRGAVSSAG